MGPTHTLFVRDIHLNGSGNPSATTDLLCQCLCLRKRPVQNRYLSPALSQRPTKLATKHTSTAGHHCDPVSKVRLKW